jgi:hypothetical protein
MQAMALNTNAAFGYAPDTTDQKLFMAALKKVPVDNITDEDIKGKDIADICEHLV